MHMNQNIIQFIISVWGTGNVALDLSLALKTAGHHLEYICGRDSGSGDKIVRHLTEENSGRETLFTTDYFSVKELSDYYSGCF